MTDKPKDRPKKDPEVVSLRRKVTELERRIAQLEAAVGAIQKQTKKIGRRSMRESMRAAGLPDGISSADLMPMRPPKII